MRKGMAYSRTPAWALWKELARLWPETKHFPQLQVCTQQLSLPHPTFLLALPTVSQPMCFRLLLLLILQPHRQLVSLQTLQMVRSFLLYQNALLDRDAITRGPNPLPS